MLTHLIDGLGLATQTVCLAATSAFSNGSSLHHGGGDVRQYLGIQEGKRKRGRKEEDRVDRLRLTWPANGEQTCNGYGEMGRQKQSVSTLHLNPTARDEENADAGCVLVYVCDVLLYVITCTGWIYSDKRMRLGCSRL